MAQEWVIFDAAFDQAAQAAFADFTQPRACPTYINPGFYRITPADDDPDALFKLETHFFVNISGQIEILAVPFIIAQLRNGDILRVDSGGRNGMLTASALMVMTWRS